MNIELKIKQLENFIESNPDIFPTKMDFDMPEDELKRRYDQMLIEIKERYDLNDSGVKEYSQALEKWEEINKTDEVEAGKFWGNYESGLTIKKWEKVTGMKWEGNIESNRLC